MGGKSGGVGGREGERKRNALEKPPFVCFGDPGRIIEEGQPPNRGKTKKKQRGEKAIKGKKDSCVWGGEGETSRRKSQVSRKKGKI